MPIQTVNYETSESQKGIPIKTLIKTYLAYLLYLSGWKILGGIICLVFTTN